MLVVNFPNNGTPPHHQSQKHDRYTFSCPEKIKWLLDLPLALECEGRSFWEIFQNAFPSSSMVALSTSPVCLQNRLHQKKLRFCKICCWQPHTWKPLTMNNPTSWQTYSVTNFPSFPSLRCCNLNVAQKKNRQPGQKQVLDFYSDEVSFSNEFEWLEKERCDENKVSF